MNYVLTETQVLNFLRRRFSFDDLNDLVRQAKYRIDLIEESVYGIDNICHQILMMFLIIGTEQDYWDSYLKLKHHLFLI
jgi:hypothetical protein